MCWGVVPKSVYPLNWLPTEFNWPPTEPTAGTEPHKVGSILAFRHINEGQNLQCFPFFNIINWAVLHASFWLLGFQHL